jgi:RNA polymerase sigma factor (TIGR02999 family)
MFRACIFGLVSEVTRILSAIEQGDPHAAEHLLPLVYDELRKLAAHKLAQERPGQTLQATALVHEAYMRLVGSQDAAAGQEKRWEDRKHFFAAAAEAMRRILIDRAREKRSVKRGGNRQRLDIDAIDLATTAPPDQLLALDEALTKLARGDPAAAQLVKLRYFAGLTVEEAGKALGISTATAYRHWNYARAWLHAELRENAES